MSITPSSKTRLASISEVTIGTIPTSPTWQVMRFLSSDLRVQKQTEVPDEIRADRNVGGIVDVGRMISGTIKTNLSYGTYDDWLTWLMNADWATNVIKNGATAKTGALEARFTTDAGTNMFVRYAGMRINTLDMVIEAKKAVTCDWGFMGVTGTTGSSILSGATYTDATTTDIFNGGLNVGSLAITGISNSPKMRRLSLKINNNIDTVNVVGQYDPYGHVMGRCEVSGSMECLFETLDAYNAILGHDTVAPGFTLEDAAGNSYDFAIPKAKLLDGGPVVGGNGQAVIVDIPFQAFYDSSSSASIGITRTAA